MRVRRLLLALFALVAVSATVAACGVPIDEQPREIAQTTLPPSGSGAPTTVVDDGSPTVAVYFLLDDGLVRQDYPVAGEPTVVKAVGFSLGQPAAGSDPGVRTAVPPGTKVRSLEVDDGTAIIDLTSEMSDVSGSDQTAAFAQIVFTALEFDDVQRVRFLVDGSPIDAPTEDGNLAVVTGDNYDKLNPR